MSFSECTRQFWLKVGDNKCQWEYYSEGGGWQQCNQTAKHVHHITPEGTDLAKGNDSERAAGMGLCQNHHVKNAGDEEFSYWSSMHPDAGEAYKNYGEWKRQNLHMRAITGAASKGIPRQSPFEEMVAEHHRKQKAGERYHTGTPEIDEYYKQKMTDKATVYLAEHPEDKKPDTKTHPRFDPKRKKHWYDGLFD